MNRLGVIVDVAHSGWQTCLDAAEVSEYPIVSSHSGVWELMNHCRCKSDEVMQTIVKRGGLIGITNVPAFLGGDGDISAMLDHIDYAAKKFGAESLTIGTDRPYVSSSENLERSKLPDRRRGRTDFNWFWPPTGFATPEFNQEHQHQSMSWTNWPLFTVGLVQRGYSDEDIRKIVGGNFLRVAREVLPSQGT
jgi:membrane dipeptidase